jgi:hypothetical protein
VKKPTCRKPVFWNVAPCLVKIYRRFKCAYCLHYQTTRRNIPEDSHRLTRHRDNLRSHQTNLSLKVANKCWCDWTKEDKMNRTCGTQREVSRTCSSEYLSRPRGIKMGFTELVCCRYRLNWTDSGNGSMTRFGSHKSTISWTAEWL